MKKFLLYILILITFLALTSWTNVSAQSPDGKGTCYDANDKPTDLTENQCKLNGSTLTQKAYYWVPKGATKPNCVYNSSSIPTNEPCTPDANHTPSPTPTCTAPQVLKDGKCVNGPTVDPIYHLLSKLPCEKGTAGCDANGELSTFDTSQSNNLSGYLNLMIKLFIGICAVLAVVMIVMGGLEYMTSELISSKEAGKEKIRNAILGLLLALGAYTLLYTINPDILDTKLTSLAPATVVVMLEGETLADAVTSDSGTAVAGPTTLCPNGIQKTTSGILACGSIAQNLDKMIAAAKQAGINISGGGYRSPERQKQLRISHCNGDFTTIDAACTPPTALPGASRHNNGLAFDLRCDGTTIQTSDNKCFIWLKANAGKFGLYNLQSEPWHWSIDGH